MKLRVSQKNKLSTKLISFLPFLKAGFDELYEEVKKISEVNPLVEVKSKKFIPVSNLKNAITDKIELLTTHQEGFYENLISQIEAPLFPTKISQQIAMEIVKDINSEGYFEGDEKEIAKRLKIPLKKVEAVRERFIYLNPAGVGAKDLKEAMLFQLYALEIDEGIFELAKKMILNLEKIDKYVNEKNYKEALKVIKNLKIVPAEEFVEKEEIIPEIIVLNSNGNLEIKLNDDYYPEITIKDFEKSEYVKEKFKEAKSLVEALEMRKATLKKIALMIVELQYEFFLGGVIKPMRIKDLASELEFAPSTISRAISNKYLLCNRGVISLKNFFSTALDDEVSSNEIKEEIKKIVAEEDREKPLSDEKIANLINEKYNLKLVRRTITKYREALQIPSSRERKRIYKLQIS